MSRILNVAAEKDIAITNLEEKHAGELADLDSLGLRLREEFQAHFALLRKDNAELEAQLRSKDTSLSELRG
jgi:hypothetical protein